MARISIPQQRRHIDGDAEVAAFLRSFGITYERWPLADRVQTDAPADEILRAYAPEIDTLKERGGYVTADVINVTPDTPGLDALLARFSQEHRHTDDEIRFVVKGAGIFHIHPEDRPVFAIEVEAGDLINVPAGMRHWFDLCADRTIRAIRLFRDPSGWTPSYVAAGVHGDYTPVCWGPQYVSPDVRITPLVLE